MLLETADLDTRSGARAPSTSRTSATCSVRSPTEAGLRDTDEFARSFHILMKGSIVQAGEGDVDAAKRAKEMARDLIAKYR